MKIEKFREVLQQSPDLEKRDQKGRTALFRASRLGKPDLLRLLLDFRADPNALDSSGEAPLQAAARYGHPACLEMLIAAGADPDHCPPPESSQYSETALCSAARKHSEIAKALLRHGANPNIASSAKRLALGMALTHSADIELVQLLIQKGADVNALDHVGNTPLHHAAEVGNIPMIRILLDAGANVDSVNRGGEPVLCSAVLRSDGDIPAVVRALLAYRPDLSLKARSWEKTALGLAVQQGYTEAAEILRAAGSPLPEPEGGSSPEADFDDESELHEEESEDVAVSVGFSFVPSSSPSSEDKSLAAKTMRDRHSLFRRFGWRTSASHWLILKSLDAKAIPAERVAYYIRGWRNSPKGQELADGLEFLGESYHDALERLVQEGLVAVTDPIESLALTHDTAKIKAIAKRHSLKIAGSKHELIQRLIDHVGLDNLMEELPPHPHYGISDKGRAALLPSDPARQEIIGILRTELLSLLEGNELVPACLIARGLEGFLKPQPSSAVWRHDYLAAKGISQARLFLGRELPTVVYVPPRDEKVIRAIAAAATLSGDCGEKWDVWRQGLEPPLDANGIQLGIQGFKRSILLA